jgi:outer membrane biosynthesis protein TonB
VTIELVINARGRLDSARATTAPRSVGESLLLATGLHAVKSWEFRPALKDGFPVSYRKLMSLGAY